MPLSDMSERRIEALQVLESFFSTTAGSLAGQLEDLLRPTLRPGESLPDLDSFLTLIGRLLARRGEELDAADQQQSDVEADLATARRERDAIERRLRRSYVRLRSAFASTYGEAGVLQVGLDAKLPRTATRLRALCEAVLDRAADLDFDELEIQVAGPGLDPDIVKDRLEPDHQALGRSLRRLHTLRRRADSARARRKEATKEAETAYVQVGSLVKALCYLVGQPELAERTHSPVRELDRHGRASSGETP